MFLFLFVYRPSQKRDMTKLWRSRRFGLPRWRPTVSLILSLESQNRRRD
jgi:hypothetical protein